MAPGRVVSVVIGLLSRRIRNGGPVFHLGRVWLRLRLVLGRWGRTRSSHKFRGAVQTAQIPDVGVAKLPQFLERLVAAAAAAAVKEKGLLTVRKKLRHARMNCVQGDIDRSGEMMLMILLGGTHVQDPCAGLQPAAHQLRRGFLGYRCATQPS